MISVKDEAIKEGIDLEKEGMNFNWYYAEKLLNEGKKVYYWDYPKRTYIEIHKDNLKKYPIYDKNRYIADDYSSEKVFKVAEYEIYEKTHTEDVALKNHIKKLKAKNAKFIINIGQSEKTIKYFFR
jgi:hypothetical protein